MNASDLNHFRHESHQTWNWSLTWIPTNWNPFTPESLQTWIPSFLNSYKLKSLHIWIPSDQTWIHFIKIPWGLYSLLFWRKNQTFSCGFAIFRIFPKYPSHFCQSGKQAISPRFYQVFATKSTIEFFVCKCLSCCVFSEFASCKERKKEKVHQTCCFGLSGNFPTKSMPWPASCRRCFQANLQIQSVVSVWQSAQ